ncbi:hypothetical protein BSIN_4675 [Burkholderia singularis]|uniref:Uncharacterized protein n=1 Tax=Burkholderia singularis TaxID=1503053 RepID=A0A238H9M0_9BURK|nr:hypothetical protein BSIN_4675 [Burkholderia singularis]
MSARRARHPFRAVRGARKNARESPESLESFGPGVTNPGST